MTLVRSTVVPFFLTFSVLLVQGQSAVQTPSSGPELKTTSRAVVVDVLVTDNSAPVSGLTQKDFAVSEDGKAQTIDFFEPHQAGNGMPAAPTEVAVLPTLPPHVYTNEPSIAYDDAVAVLLLDNLDTEQADQVLVRDQIAGFLTNLPPGMRVAIYTLNSHLQLLQGFTSDRDLLRAAIESKGAMPEKSVGLRTRTDAMEDSTAVQNTGNPFTRQSQVQSIQEYTNTQHSVQTTTVITAMQQLGRALAAVPGRKNLVWFASTFPLALYPEGDNRKALVGYGGHELPEALSETVNLLTTARIALYPVSARGLMNDRSTNADTGSGSVNWNPNQTSSSLRAIAATMEQLATNTGGLATYTTNNLSGALTRDLKNGTQYYTLAYTPTNAKPDGTFRRIEVKLVEGKYKLAYRRGYYATENVAGTAGTTNDPLAPLLTNGLPDATQIVYRIRVNSEQQPTTGNARAGGNAKLSGPSTRYRIDFLIPADSLTFVTSPAGTHDAKIRVAMVAYGNDGKAANWTGGEMKLSLSDASYAKAQRTGIAAPMEIDLPQADVLLVTGIWDTASQRAGTLRIPVRVKSDAAELRGSQ